MEIAACHPSLYHGPEEHPTGPKGWPREKDAQIKRKMCVTCNLGPSWLQVSRPAGIRCPNLFSTSVQSTSVPVGTSPGIRAETASGTHLMEARWLPAQALLALGSDEPSSPTTLHSKASTTSSVQWVYPNTLKCSN